MTSILSRSSSVVCVFAWLATASPVQAAEDGSRKPDVGVVHAAGDEAWIDVPASLGDTWKATLAELKERGRLTDADLSYVESNGQIALESLWIAVLPGASLDAPITRVRMVVLVSAEDHEQHTAALVGAGALLGAIAERLPAPSATPAPFGVAPAPAAPEYETNAEPAAANDQLVATYNTYNTYNTYDSYPGYSTPDPVYVSYAPSVVYVWKPWWWLGWCNNGWFFGWNTWGPSCWNTCWNFGWGWGSSCSPWWNWPSNPSCSPNWGCNPWWWACNNNNSCLATSSSINLRVRNSFSQTPTLTFSRPGARTGSAGSITSTDSGRVATLRDGSKGSGLPRRSSGSLASVDAFPPRNSPSVELDHTSRGSSTAPGRNSQPSHSIVVSERSSAGTRAKPGSVTKLKGLTLTTKLGAIHDAGSTARASAVPSGTATSPGFSASSSSKPTSPFTIGGGNSGGHGSASRSAPGAPSSSGSSSRGSDPSPGHSSSSSSSLPFSIGSSHQGRSSSPAPQAAPPQASAPAPRSSGGSHVSSGGHVTGGSSGSMGGGSSGGGGSGGGSHGSGRSSGRGPR